MFSSLSTLELLRLCTRTSSYGPDYLVSIFTDYADAAIVVFEVNYDKEKIIPYSYWRISEQDHDLVQTTLTMLDEIPEDNVIYPLINSDTLDSKGNPIS